MSGRHRAPRSYAWRGFVAGVAAGGMIAAAISGGLAAASDTTPSAQIASDALQIAALASDIQAQLAAPTPAPSDAPTPSDTPSPTLTPSDSPAPSATPAAATGCLATPSACGYPDATNTGASGALTVYAGKFVTSSDGQVVENLDIQGCLQVKNAGVIVRNVRIEGGCTYSLDTTNATGATTITDTTVFATSGQAASAALRDVDATRLDISGGNDIAKLWGTTTLADSYLHDATRTTTSHDDVIQIVSGGPYEISHDTLLAYTGGTAGQWADGIGDPMNAVLQVGTLNGALDVITFADNLCDGGNYSINGGDPPAFPMATPIYRDNRFGSDVRYGIKTHMPAGAEWSGNVADDTGEPVG